MVPTLFSCPQSHANGCTQTYSYCHGSSNTNTNGHTQTYSYSYCYASSHTNTGKYTPAHIAACVPCSPHVHRPIADVYRSVVTHRNMDCLRRPWLNSAGLGGFF